MVRKTNKNVNCQNTNPKPGKPQSSDFCTDEITYGRKSMFMAKY